MTLIGGTMVGTALLSFVPLWFYAARDVARRELERERKDPNYTPPLRRP